MAVTQNTYTGDGTTVLFSFTFPYLDQADVKVSLNGVDTTAYTLANATTVQMNTAPGVGVGVRVYRATDIDDASATFFPGSAIRSEDLNRNFDQILYVSQETRTFAESTDSSAIQAQVTSAVNTANAANTTANNASTTANGIAGTANTALSNSTAAVTTANSAVTTANAAQATANGISATANAAQTTANAALPRSGGTMTGSIAFAGLQTTATTSSPSIVQLSNSISSTSEVLAATPKAVKDAKDDAVSTAATGAASIYLPRAGGTMTGVITYAAAQPKLVRATAVATTSGTSVDFTGIPSWARRITVVIDGYSSTPSDIVYPMFQLGDSGGIETTGYLVYASILGTDTSNGVSQGSGSFGTAGFFFLWGSQTSLRYGTFTFTNITGNQWTGAGLMGGAVPGGFVGTAQTGGTKTLSDTLDRVRLTTTSGTDTFDAGTVNIIYEG